MQMEKEGNNGQPKTNANTETTTIVMNYTKASNDSHSRINNDCQVKTNNDVFILEEEIVNTKNTPLTFLRREFRLKNFLFNSPLPNLLVSNQWGLPHKFYLVWRLVWAAYHLSWIIYDWIRDAKETTRVGVWLVYLTNWAYLVLTVNTVVQAIVVCYLAVTKKVLEEGTTPWYLKVVWGLYETTSTISLLVTVLYFALLFTGKWILISTIVHLFNSVYVIVDLCITAVPVRILHVIYPLVFAITYVIFNIIYWAAGGRNNNGEPYVYKPLNWAEAQKAAPLAIGCVFVGVPVLHFILWTMYVIRVSLRLRCKR